MRKSFARRGSRLPLIVAWTAAIAVAGSAAAESCPYPLGDHLLTNDVISHGGSPSDPSQQLVDTVWISTQLAPGTFVYDGGILRFAFEGETDFEIPGTTFETEAHIIVYKEFSSRTGWNVRPDFVSTPDVSDPVPVGDHTSPTMVAVGGNIFVAWQVAGPSDGQPGYPNSGSYLLVRERTGSGWEPTQLLSPTDGTSRSSLPKAAAIGDEPLFVYQTNRLGIDSLEFYIAAQSVEAGAPSAPVNVSVPNDGWSDEGVSLASESSSATAAAVWSARDTRDVFANGGSQVWVALRDADGTWRPPILVNPPGQDRIDKPAVAWLDGAWYVAWTARDENVSTAGDTSLFLRMVDRSNAALSEMWTLTNDTYRGDESAPAIVAFQGSLELIWNSNSATDGSGATWQIPRTMRCEWNFSNWLERPIPCTPQMVDRPDDLLVGDLWPGLVVIDDSLIATYGLNFGNFIGTAANQHTVTRLLSHGPWPSDTLRASFGADAPEPDGEGTARLAVRFESSNGTPARSDHFALRLKDGNVMRLPPGFSSAEFKVPYTDGAFALPVEALWCGQPIPLTQFALGPPPGSGLFESVGMQLAVLLAAAAVALIALRHRAPHR